MSAAAEPIRLLPALEQPGLPAADPSAQAVAERVAGHANVVVLGAPGTGKTTTALRLLTGSVAAGRDAILLAPTRARADLLRARAAHLLGQGHGDGRVRVRTPASLALTILTTSLTERPDPLPAPVLLAGAEEDAALAAMVGAISWPDLPAEAVGSRAFRSQLRNLLARAAEMGISAEELAQWGRALDVPIWGPASQLLRTWDAQGRPSPELRSQTRKMDTARLQDRAREALETWQADAVAAPRPVPDLVIVDDYQDCTAATARLLTTLATPDGAGHRAQVVVLGDPDAAVETFRGGTPSLLVAAEDRSGLAAERLVLSTRHRGGPALAELWRDQAERIPITGTASHRRPRLAGGDAPPVPGTAAGAPRAVPPGAPQGVEAIVASSPAQEAAHVARALRAERIHHGTAWQEMAVIVRSSAQASATARELRRRGLPVAPGSPAVLLRAEPAAAALVNLVRAGVEGRLGRVGREPPELASALELLSSPLIGLTALDLRRLRRRLRAEQTAPAAIEPGVGERPVASADDALLATVSSPEAARAFHQVVAGESLAAQAQALCRGAEVIAAVLQALAEGRHDAESLLWAAWAASGRAEAWRETALSAPEGAGGAQSVLAQAAERDLDVVTALFKRAEVWAERRPGAPASAFLDELAAEALPSDSVAPHGARPAGVTILTPAAAAGRQWEVVAVMGLNRDSWPDLRLRDSITRAGLLVDAATGRLPRGAQGMPVAQVDPVVARAHVRADERRMLVAALTRATRRLLVTASVDAEHAPSTFFTEIAERTTGLVRDEEGVVRPAQDVGDLTLRGLVGELRQAVVLGHLPQATQLQRRRAGQAALILARLQRAHVPGADPATWAGGQASATAPLVGPGRPIRISPSDVEAITDCPLRWFLQRKGGSTPASAAQSLGIVIHALAERAQREELRGPALMEAFEAELPRLGYPPTWLGRQEAERARAMVERLDSYLAAVPGPAQVEVPIQADLLLHAPTVPAGACPASAPGEGAHGKQGPGLPVILAGRIDRLELIDGPDEPRKARLIDIKTGRTPHADPEHHPQLAAYRLALEAQGHEVIGGALVLLGKEPGRDGATIISPKGAALAPSPDPDTGQDWARELVRTAALDASGTALQARSGKHCRTCPVADSCPVQPEGRRVLA
ncbi:UrvD/REP family ATP-dependent DNA helicase [Actinomyces slackii]